MTGGECTSTRAGLRIAIVGNDFGRAGAEKQMLGLIRALVADGHDVLVVSILPPGEMAASIADLGVPIVALKCGGWPQPLRVIASATRVFRWSETDLIISFVYQANVLGRVAGRLAGVPSVVSSIRNERFGGRRPWVRDLTLRLTDRLATVTTTNSSATAEQIILRKVVPRHRLEIVPNSVAVEGSSEHARDAGYLGQLVSLRGDCFVWICIARLEPQKDHDTLLRAFAMLPDDGSVLVMVGGGSLRNELGAFAHSLGLDGRVRFLGHRDDVPRLLAGADALVLASRHEGMPNAVMEALAVGLPVVASDVGGVRELVEPGVTGFVVARSEPAALARAMEEMTRLSCTERRAMGCVARRRMSERYSVDEVEQRWRRVVAKYGRPRVTAPRLHGATSPTFGLR